jgi:hypothetical protein
MSQFAISARQQFGRKQRRPVPGNPASDRILRGPGCHRHNRVCADASAATGLLQRLIPTAIGMRFRRHDGIYQSDAGFFQTINSSQTPPPASAQTRARERAGRIALSPIVLMSSGRLFLDQVGRHQSLSPLHRRDQNNLIAQPKGSNYHRTVTSVLTVCVTPGDKPSFRHYILSLWSHQATWRGCYSWNGQTSSSLTGRTSGLPIELARTWKCGHSGAF